MARCSSELCILGQNSSPSFGPFSTRLSQRCIQSPISLSYDHPDAQVVMVHSGSQANGLAIQLARAQTGATDVIVFEHSFHGRYIFDNLRTVYDRKEHFSLTSVSCSLSESSACSTVLKETQEPWVNTILMLFLLIIILILLFKGSCTSCSRPLPRCPP